MPDLPSLLAARLREAFDAVVPGADPVLRPSDREGADFQANGALALAKELGRNPREVAEEALAAAHLEGICRIAEVSGPGFVNLVLTEGAMAEALGTIAASPTLGVAGAAHPETIVVDYSAPNVAKEMHVGNLRSTIIGDALCRVLGRMGHRVIRENHLGDWGTPFGMLIEHLVEIGEEATAGELSVGDLSGFYQAARKSFDADPAFADRARNRVVALQAGDAETLRLWGILVAASVSYFDDVYTKLGVLLDDDDLVGESFYNPMLPSLIDDLDAAGILVDDDGAACVFPPGYENRDGQPLPLIVRKSDGGYGYAATDLAAIRDRIDRLGATTVLYVIGAPQATHLSMCFAAATMAGWVPDGVRLVHVPFGSVLGPDKKILRTRAGESVKLVALLDEGIDRARAAIEERHRGVGDDAGFDVEGVARAVGIGAVKYADLMADRIRDYVFDWDRMLPFEGNTGPYLQYAHARIRSVFRRAADEGVSVPGPGDAPIVLADPAERALGLVLLGYPEALAQTLDAYALSKLCGWLFSLAEAFTSFYERCPILRAEDVAVRSSRLALADLAARHLADGLALLGIDAPDEM